MNNYIYIAVMAAVSYTIRVLPLTLIRKPIKNQFIQSFLYYVPYVTLAVMTFPAIIHATQTPISGLVALIAGIIAAWLGAGLFPVSVIWFLSAVTMARWPTTSSKRWGRHLRYNARYMVCSPFPANLQTKRTAHDGVLSPPCVTRHTDAGLLKRTNALLKAAWFPT